MKAWESNERKCLFMHDLITLGGSVIEAEARSKKFDEHSLIVVLRDTSERHMRFEAEKKIITATTGVSKRIILSTEELKRCYLQLMTLSMLEIKDLHSSFVVESKDHANTKRIISNKEGRQNQIKSKSEKKMF